MILSPVGGDSILWLFFFTFDFYVIQDNNNKIGRSNMGNTLQYLHSYYGRLANGRDDILSLRLTDLKTGEKILRFIKNPKQTVYVTKKQYRNYSHKKEWEYINRTDRLVANRQEMSTELCKALDMNPNSYTSRTALRSSPYIYGTSMDIESKAKQKYTVTDPSLKLNPDFGIIDIEQDVAVTKKICCASYTSVSGKTYTVALQEFLNKKGNSIEEIKENFKRTRKEFYEDIKSDIRPIYDSMNMEVEVVAVDSERALLIYLFKQVHLDKPDFVFAWGGNNYDYPVLAERMEFCRLNPKDLFCHPDVPPEYRSFKISAGPDADWTDKWGWVKTPGYTQFMCAMSLYSRLRKAKGKERSYKLDYIARKVLGVGKLKMTIDNHYIMQQEYFEEYVRYNVIDNWTLFFIMHRTKDLLTLMSLCSASKLEDFSKQTVMLSDEFNKFVSTRKMVMGGKSTSWRPWDDKITNKGGGVLSPNLAINTGSPVVNGLSTETDIILWAFDIDVSSMYPSFLEAADISRENKISTAITIDKLVDTQINDIFTLVIDPEPNTVELGEKYLNLPGFEDMEKLILDRLNN